MKKRLLFILALVGRWRWRPSEPSARVGRPARQRQRRRQRRSPRRLRPPGRDRRAAGLLQHPGRRRRRPRRPRRPRLLGPDRLRARRTRPRRPAHAGPAERHDPRPAPPRPAPARSPAPATAAAPAAPAAPAAAPTAAAAAAAATAAATTAAAAPKPAATAAPQSITHPDIRNPDGTPTDANPGLSIADFGASPIGVPNFMIDQFEIPPFLLPIYQACGTQYGIPWEVLASINKIESAFGTNMGPSTAGAVGWMQFLPSTWKAYGVDANDDGEKDPYNPVDAICAAARYLNAAGGDKDLRQRDLRLQPRRLVRRRGPARRAAVRQAARGPDQLDHRPDRGSPLPRRRRRALRRRPLRARGPRPRQGRRRTRPTRPAPTRSSPRRRARGINIYSHEGAPVVAVNDGVIKEIGESRPARQVHRPPGRLRQPLHLRAARRRLRRLPRAQGAEADRRRLPARQPGATTRRPTSPRRRAPARRSDDEARLELAAGQPRRAAPSDDPS